LVFTRQDGLLATVVLWKFLLVNSNLLLIARKLADVFGHSVFISARRPGLFRESRVPPIAERSCRAAVIVTFLRIQQFEPCFGHGGTLLEELVFELFFRHLVALGRAS
jgi:hypothetical protein